MFSPAVSRLKLENVTEIAIVKNQFEIDNAVLF